MVAAAERRREIERVLSLVGLEEAAHRKARDYSGGMRRRLGIARALLGSPPILIVDEPTTGLDVDSRNRLRESLLRIAPQHIILFSTHIASDLAATASRVLVLAGGRLLFDGTSAALIDRARGRVFAATLDDVELEEVRRAYRLTARVRLAEGTRVRALATSFAERADPGLRGEAVEPSLEEAYLVVLADAAGPDTRPATRKLGPWILKL
jgi:ABC-type multidrug transport system ATPase subunit